MINSGLLLGEVMERTCQSADPPARPNQRLLTPSFVFGTDVLSPLPIAVFKTAALREQCGVEIIWVLFMSEEFRAFL